MVLYGGGKLNLSESVDCEYCRNSLEWATLVLAVNGVI